MNEGLGKSGKKWLDTLTKLHFKLNNFCRLSVVDFFRAFDTSKQAVGAAVVHFANVFLADMFTGDPCTW